MTRTILALTLGDETACTVDTSGVELDEFEILVGQASTGDHSHTVSGTCVCRCAAEVGSTISTSGQDRVLGKEAVQGAVLHVEGDNTNALAVLHDQVEREVLDEEVGIVAQGLAVERVQQCVAREVGRGGAAVGLAALAEVERLTAERALVDLALLRTREGNTEVLKLYETYKFTQLSAMYGGHGPR